MEKELVSIMVPCYNGEKFLDRLFNSFYSQTYKNLQIIFVNDGSTDRTEEKTLKYLEKFEKRGIRFLYLYQENRGQASAINTALPYVAGEYCMWFDADDFMSVDHIEKKVNFLRKHSNIELVMCKGCIVDEENTGSIIGNLGYEKAVGRLFEDILFEYRRCTPGLYMVRTKALFGSLCNGRIYESQAGQNMQLLLPISKRENNGYIEDMLYYYVFRKNSHSRSFYSSDDYIKRLDDLEDMRLHIIEKMELPYAYKKDLYYYIKLFVLIQRIECLDRHDIYEKKSYVGRLVKDFLYYTKIKENVGNRGVFLWGACQKSDKIKDMIEGHSDYRIKGYIDSDKYKIKQKRDNLEICGTEQVELEKMYIIVPLEIHKDILNILQESGCVSGKDFFYPKYEIKSFVESKIENENI